MVKHFKESYLPVVDFGSQTTNNIARRVREQDVYSEILPYTRRPGRILKGDGVILSGGPSSVYERRAPKCSSSVITQKEKPILGICYGMQLATKVLGGKVKRGRIGEYGETRIRVVEKDPLFEELPEEFTVWMSHGDEAVELPRGAEVLAITDDGVIAAYRRGNFRGVQFHPEVDHTQYGRDMLRNFAYNICNAPRDWSILDQIEVIGEGIRNQVGKRKVMEGLSGGGDSSVLAYILKMVLGEANTAFIYVDHGLQRKGETEEFVERSRNHLKIEPTVIDAEERFLKELYGVDHPERQRKIIGREFGRVFAEEARRLYSEGFDFLAQGTLYPDVIESISPFKKGPSKKIKSHHNVGGMPKWIRNHFKVIEPFKWLFKDEVRSIGLELMLPEHVVVRQPFPGPGAAVRINNWKRKGRPGANIIREVDAIARDFGYKGLVSPILTVGVQGDGRTEKNLVYLCNGERDWDRMREAYSEIVTRRLTNRVMYLIDGINMSQDEMLDCMDLPLAKETLDAWREADMIATSELDRFDVPYNQAPICMHPGHNGVFIDINPKMTEDYMTARTVIPGSLLPWECLDEIAAELMGEPYISTRVGMVEGVALEIGDKPPATIEQK